MGSACSKKPNPHLLAIQHKQKKDAKAERALQRACEAYEKRKQAIDDFDRKYSTEDGSTVASTPGVSSTPIRQSSFVTDGALDGHMIDQENNQDDDGAEEPVSFESRPVSPVICFGDLVGPRFEDEEEGHEAAEDVPKQEGLEADSCANKTYRGAENDDLASNSNNSNVLSSMSFNDSAVMHKRDSAQGSSAIVPTYAVKDHLGRELQVLVSTNIEKGGAMVPYFHPNSPLLTVDSSALDDQDESDHNSESASRECTPTQTPRKLRFLERTEDVEGHLQRMVPSKRNSNV